MRMLLLPALAGLLLLGGCKKAETPDTESGSSDDAGIAELQKKLDEALKR